MKEKDSDFKSFVDKYASDYEKYLKAKGRVVSFGFCERVFSSPGSSHLLKCFVLADCNYSRKE